MFVPQKEHTSSPSYTAKLGNNCNLFCESWEKINTLCGRDAEPSNLNAIHNTVLTQT
jgi:hypothetical protein